MQVARSCSTTAQHLNMTGWSFPSALKPAPWECPVSRSMAMCSTPSRTHCRSAHTGEADFVASQDLLFWVCSTFHSLPSGGNDGHLCPGAEQRGDPGTRSRQQGCGGRQRACRGRAGNHCGRPAREEGSRPPRLHRLLQQPTLGSPWLRGTRWDNPLYSSLNHLNCGGLVMGYVQCAGPDILKGAPSTHRAAAENMLQRKNVLVIRNSLVTPPTLVNKAGYL